MISATVISEVKKDTNISSEKYFEFAISCAEPHIEISSCTLDNPPLGDAVLAFTESNDFEGVVLFWAALVLVALFSVPFAISDSALPVVELS